MDGLGATTLRVPVPSDTLFRPTATFAEENPSSRAAARLVVVHIWARGPAVRGRVRRVGVAMMPPERSGVTPLVSQVRPPSALIFPRVAARGFYSLSPRSSSEDRRRPTTVASDVDPLVRAFLRSPLYRASPRVLPDDPSSPFPDFFSSSWTSRTRARRARAWVAAPTLVGPDATSTLHPDTAGSDLYERFESLVRDASRRAFVSERGWRPHAPPRATGVPVPPPAKSIEVSAQFDARAHAGDQRGRRGAPRLRRRERAAEDGPPSNALPRVRQTRRRVRRRARLRGCQREPLIARGGGVHGGRFRRGSRVGVPATRRRRFERRIVPPRARRLLSIARDSWTFASLLGTS